MSVRLHNVAAALALTALTTAQAMAFTSSQIAFTPQYPQLQITCYTRIIFSNGYVKYSARKCNTCEKPLSVRDLYVE